MFDLADVVSLKPYISHEEARLELGLSPEDFAEVLEMLRAYLKTGLPLRPLPRPKPSWWEVLMYG